MDAIIRTLIDDARRWALDRQGLAIAYDETGEFDTAAAQGSDDEAVDIVRALANYDIDY